MVSWATWAPIFVSFYFFGGRKIAPPSMVKGGPLCRWTRVRRKGAAQPSATVPRPENAATTKPKKKTTRTHSHRLAPTWCGAGELLVEGWRCGCNPRSCRAVVEKSGQRPPVGAPPEGGAWGLQFPMGPGCAPASKFMPMGPSCQTFVS